jgi:predicted permease
VRSDRRGAANTPAVLALLKPGVTLEQANLEMAGYAQRLAREFPDTNQRYHTALVEPLIKTFTPRQLQGLLYSMLAVCVGVLLLGCANVMNMQFARATLRAKELAVRSSLGASRNRLIRQMLTESLLLACLGATLGVAGAFYCTDLLLATVRNLPNPIPAYITFDIDLPVLAGVVLTTGLAAVISGIVPAWMASRANPVEVLKEGGRGNTSRGIAFITRGLVVFQIVVTCIILIASLLQVQAILRQQRLDYGYDTGAVLTARLGLMDGDYPDANARRLFYDRLLQSLRASAEFSEASLTSRFRMAFSGNSRIEIEGREYSTDRDRPNVNLEQISDGYFASLGLKLREGRDFNAEDTDTKLPVAIANAGFAQKYYPGESAVGRRFRSIGPDGRSPGPWRTIVGVAADLRMTGPFNNPNVEEVGFYVPFHSNGVGPVSDEPASPKFGTIVVRPRAGRPEAAANALRREVQRVDPNLPLYFVGTPREGIDSFLGQNRIIAVMFSLFGAVATLLAAVGLYGVMSFAVNQRTQEFGIRMALGADHGRILGLVMRQGSVQLGVGLVVGLVLAGTIAVLGGQGIRNSLGGVISPTDPLTYAIVTVLLAVVSLVATLVPARRATRVDPMIALRAE